MRLRQIRAQVGSDISEARYSILNLRSPRENTRDLVAAMRRTGQRAVQGTAIEFALVVRGVPRPCAYEVGHQALLIGREALSNAVRHAHAREISAELCYEAERLVLRVVDDGCGFDSNNPPADTDHHYGLLIMQERAAQVGGQVTFHTNAGTGTVVEVRPSNVAERRPSGRRDIAMTEGGNRPIRVLCVDDHPVVLEGVALVLGLQADMQVVGLAASGEEAVALHRAKRPDITLMDLRLPVMSGLDAIRAIVKDFPDSRIVVLTTYDGDEDIARALNAGAVTYLIKDTVPGDLVRVIREVHMGGSPIQPDVRARLEERSKHSTLTKRETEVVELMGKRDANQGNSCRPRHQRGNSARSRQARACQARCARPLGGGDGRGTSRHHSRLNLRVSTRQRQLIHVPPSTGMTAPLVYAPARDAK